MRAGLLLDGLARLGPVHVVVVPLFPEPDGLRPPDDSRIARFSVLGLEGGPDPRSDLMARLAHPALRAQATLLHPRPALCSPATLAAAESLAELVADAAVVLVTRLYLAPFLDVTLARDRRPVCVLDVDDVESSTRRRRGDVEEADRYERLERHYTPRFDLVLTCSTTDAGDIASRCGVQAEVVPNAVRVPAARPASAAKWDLLFVANFSYGPNAEAATWLCRRVLPGVPSATVALVGHDPVPEVAALAQRGRTIVTGTVPEVRPFYASSRVAVVPLLAGGGTSIKLLEAFAHRRPVVATWVGARGCPVRDGEHLLLADEPDRFAAACRRLLADGALAAELAGAGYDLVRRSFTTDQVSTRLAEVVGGYL
jgi:glycosyltransferase involved in cell wall biosynthesis